MRRYGIGEWYGHSFVKLASAQRKAFGVMQIQKLAERKNQPCPFRSRPGAVVRCTKEGGVCSIREFEEHNGVTKVVGGADGSLRATCPNRFQQDDVIYRWVAGTVLGNKDAIVIGEIPFLKSEDEDSNDSVVRIDNILLLPGSAPMRWCALEIQAVYFSGDSMAKEFSANAQNGTLSLPSGKRRPDYRSSGPKRLMPQLQTKVPTLRRWGKKMAVVVDEGFFGSLGKMDDVSDVSNCDVAWFVVKFDEKTDPASLKPSFVRLTTLERAVEGLTGGVPVTLGEFEARIRAKAAHLPTAPPDLE